LSITTQPELLTAVANWSGRSDLTSRIPEFVALAEAKMNRKLRTKDMETKNATFSITGEYVATPAGFGGVRSFYLNTNPKQNLQLMTSDLQTGLFGTTSGKPRFYDVIAGNFRFAPPPDSTYSATLIYWLTVPALTGSATTNWLLTSHPDAYLYGCLAELAGFAKDWDGAAKWVAAMYGVLQEVVDISNKD
jgi:hypothetical protein